MARFLLAALLALLVALSSAALVPAAALADGDPASDVLLGENVFYPYSPNTGPALQKTLNAETAAAKRAGFPLKVALIASPVDLGVIPDLFGKPQRYADFLDQEISFQGTQPLLVVMWNGYGVAGIGAGAKAAVAALPKPAGKQPDDLARAAITAVAKLAKQTGHPVRDVPGVPGAGSSSNSTVVIIAVLVAAALATAGGLALVTVRRRRAGAEAVR